MIYCIRGAITIEENTKQNILENTINLLETIIEENKIRKDDIISILFTATDDITKAYPAIATRNIGITNCAIMCLQEMYVEGSLRMCIRVMLTVRAKLICDMEVKNIYLKDAKKLRPDIYEKDISVAIDGPAGSGKSTICSMVAKELNFTYVDTGAMFRAVTYYFIQKGISSSDEYTICEHMKNIDIKIEYENGKQQIYLDNENVTKEIRKPNIAKKVSNIAKIPFVRERLLEIQQNMAKGKNIIMDGRDIGTKVLPNASVKIYLDADIEERAKRRYEECVIKGQGVSFESIKEDIIKRDNIDKTRENAPLKIADDAIAIDTTHLNTYEVSEKVIDIIKDSIQ